jgi:hypothetical protein
MNANDDRARADERIQELRDVLGDEWGGVTVSIVPWGRTFVIRMLDAKLGRLSDFPLSVPPKQMVREFLYPDLPKPRAIDPATE